MSASVVDVALVVPPIDNFGETPAPSLGVLFLAGSLRRSGFRTVVVDLPLADNATVALQDVVSSLKPEIVAFSCMRTNLRTTLELCDVVRAMRSDAYVVLGGTGASPVAEQLIANHGDVDAVVRGEGEQTFVDLVASCLLSAAPRGIPGTVWRDGEKVVDNGPPKLISNLDALAPPAWDLIDIPGYLDLEAYVPVLGARGCTSSCPFCPSPAFWQYRVRRHSPDKFVDQIKDLSEHGCNRFYVADDDFVGDAGYAESTLALMRRVGIPIGWRCNARVDSLTPHLLESMSLGGCRRITIGLESASPLVRSRIGKGKFRNDDLGALMSAADGLGVEIKINLMFGSPSETRDDIRETLVLVQRLRPSLVTFSTMTVYPQTRLENRVQSRRSSVPSRVGSAGLPVFVDEQRLQAEIEKIERDIDFDIPKAGGW